MTLDLSLLSGSLGAEIRGIDLANLESREFEAIHLALLEHHVLAFRDQKLTPAEQIEFGARWGELFVHPIVPHIEGYPEIIAIDNHGKKHTITETWHSDVSFSERPPMASGLYALELPTAGGDTLFSNQQLAYERLSEGMKQILDGLRAIHSGAGLGAATGQGEAWRTQGQLHPVVRTHPETGRKALYVSPAFTICFENMTIEESAPLLSFLYRTGQAADLTVRHRWQPGDLVLWDNRSVQHFAIHDHGDATRRMHRITVMGDVPC
ncbi:MAG: TauD/TfdA family dioxygenase [Myxococcota bacterium]